MGQVIPLGCDAEEALVSALVELKNHCVEAVVFRRQRIRSSFYPAAYFCALLLARLGKVASLPPDDWELAREDAKRLLHRFGKLNRSPDIYTPAIERCLQTIERTCANLEFGCEPLMDRYAGDLALAGLDMDCDSKPA